MIRPEQHRAQDVVEVVRSEERLAVGTERVPTGRVRVGKRVVTEERTVTVTVRREELYLEEDAAASAGQGSLTTGPDHDTGDALELVLYAEEPVVTTRVVPVERVRVVRHRVTEQVSVPATVAQERIEIETDGTVASQDPMR